ncbi:hypothetical protein EXIGLDRAFT_831793 [Exidia glandulosa HHB12029]|uniref:NYN domain-containing protein n=1 Tax=Exidia glandulosa HHB12029 TaxID=1314781 RepID=A0A165MB60_EXIGL|nr:hypothetical protein EXIGLDRAFT_831793 [Exidia glandulosa HHB12029]
MTASKVSVYWDIENCAVPTMMSGLVTPYAGWTAAARYIERVALEYGVCVSFRAYVASDSNVTTKRPDLLAAGVSLIPTKSKMADHVLISDMITWAWDNPTGSTVVIVTGDNDFAYTMSLLRRRKIKVVLIAPMAVAHHTLKAQASVVVEWVTSPPQPSYARADSKRKTLAVPSHTTPPTSDPEPTTSENELSGSTPVPYVSPRPVNMFNSRLTSTFPTQYSPSAMHSECATLETEPSSSYSDSQATVRAAKEEGWITGTDLEDTSDLRSDLLHPQLGSPAVVDDVDPASIPLPHTPGPESDEQVQTVQCDDPTPVYSSPPRPTIPRLPPGLEQFVEPKLSQPPYSDHGVQRHNTYEFDREERPERAEPEDTWLQPVPAKQQRYDWNEGILSVHAPEFVPRSPPEWRTRYNPASPAFQPRNTIPTQFKPLADALERLAKTGVHKPLWSAIGGQLQHCKTEVFRQAGVTTMKDYLHAARDAGVCRLGEVNIAKGGEWVQLSARRNAFQRS